MVAFYVSFLLMVVYFIHYCQPEKNNFMCKFRNLNGQFVTPLPSKYISLMECCGTNTCGGVSIHVGSGTTFGTVAPGWFVERVIEADTVYLIKKRQIMVFEAPVSLTLLVSAFLSLFFSLSLSLCAIVQVKVEKKICRE